MDWTSLVADERRILNRHFTAGRGGHAIDKVVIHHMGGNLTIGGCYATWQTRAASAHYAVESSGKVGQLVWDRDTAWHAANLRANQTSIGIEHADTDSSCTAISDQCLDSGAHLVAAVCRFYGLGRPAWHVNVFGHSDFSATDCPGPLREGRPQHDAYMQRAQWWYDTMTGTASEGDELTKEEHDMLAAIAAATKVGGNCSWNYSWWDGKKGTAPGGNVYNTLLGIHSMVAELRTREAAQSAAIDALAKSKGADPEAVTKAVTKAVAAKLDGLTLQFKAEG